MSDEEPERWTVTGDTGEALLFVIVVLGLVVLWESGVLSALRAWLAA